MTADDRRLLLLRHAKSSWASEALSDCERPLNRRGERAAMLMGAYLAQQEVRPSLVLCSAATRARQTWDRVAAQLPENPEVRFLDALYLASSDEILELLSEVPAATRRVLVVGHNPGLEDLAEELVDRGARKLLDRLESGLPTAAFVEFDVGDAPWSALASGGCRLVDLARPKDLV